MRARELRNELRKQPFQPFRLVMTDGMSYDIRHPDLLMVGRRTAVVGITSKPEDELYDLTAMLDLIHIIRLEPITTKSATGKNGRKKH